MSTGGYSLVAYFAIFLFGYCIFAQDPVQARLGKYRAILFSSWIFLTIGVMWVGGILLGHGEFFWGTSILFAATGWVGVLALMGMGRHIFNMNNRFTGYLTAASYPVYIIHQAAIVAMAYYLVMVPVSPALQYIAIVVLGMVLTFGCYEILRRIRESGGCLGFTALSGDAAEPGHGRKHPGYIALHPDRFPIFSGENIFFRNTAESLFGQKSWQA